MKEFVLNIMKAVAIVVINIILMMAMSALVTAVEAQFGLHPNVANAAHTMTVIGFIIVAVGSLGALTDRFTDD